jgi:hypothetical protein
MRIFLFYLVLLTFSELSAQNNRELVDEKSVGAASVEFSTGLAYCMGDAFGSPFTKSIFNGNNYDLSLGFRHIVLKNIGYHVNLRYGNYTSDDGFFRQHGVGFYRSTTNLLELTARCEVIIPLESIFKKEHPCFVYFFLGSGVVKENVSYPPEASKGFPNFKAGVLLSGFGYTYNLNKSLSIGVEFTMQYALTDKVDGYPLVETPNKTVLYDVL